MSHSFRPEPRDGARRPRRQVHIEPVQALEDRRLLTPVVATNSLTATLVPAAAPTNTDLGTVTITSTPLANSAAPLTSVSELTSANSFGGDIVKIEAGPGGVFGSGVYAISRGAGDNADSTFRNPDIQTPINKPGVIYRVDPATGKTSVFFDLNTVQSQISSGGDASNGASPGSGLLNYYDIAFDPEGIFDGKPSMFVSSLSTTNPSNNVIYRIAPDGTFMGLYVQFTTDANENNFTRQPSAVYVPPVQQQNFLKGLFVGQGTGISAENGTDAGGFQALFFDGNEYSPGASLSGDTLPNGVTATPFTYGPQVAFASANSQYNSPVYSAFTDFGTPGAGGVQAVPGLSGVQGSQGELLIGNGANIVNNYTAAGGATPDTNAAIITPFRRFQDQSFDYYGYFSYNYPSGTVTAGTSPTYAGSLFTSDLATGLSVTVNTATALGPNAAGTAVNIPIQGPGGPIGVQLAQDGATLEPIYTNGNTTDGSNLGGRIIRISPSGQIIPFATGFHTSGAQDATSFIGSELSLSFSSDGTILYAADDDGIWQFKTVTSLADSASGQLIGLNDLRTLGAPYDGTNSAVAIVDTGVDSLTPNFRGRVATGYSVVTNGDGNDDTSAAITGHGTLLAGVISQFVPQATLDPINVFTPNQVQPSVGGTTGNATTPQNIYEGLDYLAKNPFVKDPVRPNTLDRVIAANVGFGTTTTYATETQAFKAFPQITIAFKNEFAKLRQTGIQAVAPTGQFGAPGASAGGSTSGGNVSGVVFPAVLNEVVSVTGSFPFPFSESASTPPTDPGTGVIPRPTGPVLLYGNPGGSTLSATTGAGLVAAADAIVFKDKLLASSNRNLTTDYTAPEVDVPTFQRTGSSITTAGVTVTGGTAATGYNDFQEGGTSLSSAIVTGSYALVASALNYWINIANSGGVTSDAYLNTPVGTKTLNFGSNGIENLSLYANPDGINSILEWTAVPATDSPNTLDPVDPPTLFQSTNYREFARIDVGNAIAAIEGSIAVNYLLQHGDFDQIDANHNGLITAQELQNFEDNAATTGQAEAGAMARLLGGTASSPTTGAEGTSDGETPDEPGALNRRFNFFDYAADGQLNGAISVSQFQTLAKILLPAPDAYTVTDRQKAADTGFLLSPSPLRNYSDLQHVLPTYAFVPTRVVKRFRNVSPAKFGVGKGQLPSQQGPIFTLYTNGLPAPSAAKTTHATKTAAAKAPATYVKTSTTPATTTTTTSTTTTKTPATTPATTVATTPPATSTTTPTTTSSTTPTTTTNTSTSSLASSIASLISGATASSTSSSSSSSGTSTSAGTPAASTAVGSTIPLAAADTTSTANAVAGSTSASSTVVKPETAKSQTPASTESKTSVTAKAALHVAAVSSARERVQDANAKKTQAESTASSGSILTKVKKLFKK